jgi:prepilin-type N-terminal cleavage/methylation domain-containing protein
VKTEGGFTLLELLVALGLLALGMLLFLQTSVLTLGLHVRSSRGTEALLLAQEKMEILLSQGWEDALAAFSADARVGGEVDSQGRFAMETVSRGCRYRIFLEKREAAPPINRYRVTCFWEGNSRGFTRERSVRISAAAGWNR